MLRQALRLKPVYPKVVMRKARLHALLKEWDLAIEVCAAASRKECPRRVSLSGHTGTWRRWNF